MAPVSSASRASHITGPSSVVPLCASAEWMCFLTLREAHHRILPHYHFQAAFPPKIVSLLSSSYFGKKRTFPVQCHLVRAPVYLLNTPEPSPAVPSALCCTSHVCSRSLCAVLSPTPSLKTGTPFIGLMLPGYLTLLMSQHTREH